MHPIIQKTFGGLTFEYYFRQLFLGFILAFIWVSFDGGKSIGLFVLALFNTFIYPYARFVYESIVDLILGNKIFVVNEILLLMVQFLTMFLCWFFSLFMAPIGLVLLYLYHSRRQKIKQ